VGWLHRLPYHPYEVAAQGVEVCLIPQFGRGSGERPAGEVCLFILGLRLVLYSFYVVIADSDKVIRRVVNVPKAIRVS
jgi:hypothetical protein